MQYTIGFEGAVRAELAQLLRAVQGQLNGPGSNAQVSHRMPGSMVEVSTGGGDCDAVLTKACSGGSHIGQGAGQTTESGSGNCDVVLSKDCPAGGHIGHGPEHGGHGPDAERGGQTSAIIVGAVVLVLGIVIGYMLGKRSGSGTSRN